MPHFASAAAQGEWAEVCFMKRAFEKGLRLSRPFSSRARFDFIVESRARLARSRLYRIQVKSVSVGFNGVYHLAVSHGSRRKRGYGPRDIDFLAALVIPLAAWYIIPVRAIAGCKTINLAPHAHTRRRFEPFREAWHLLCSSQPSN